MRVKWKMPLAAYKEKLQRKGLSEAGGEIVSSVPMAPPIGFHKQPSMVEHIRNMVRSEQLRMAAEAAGQESFEEADDFDVDDDPEPASAYEFEEVFEPAPPPQPISADKPSPGEAPAPSSGGPGASSAPENETSASSG